MATRRRLAEEKKKEEERKERLRRREEQREQRSLTPKLPRIPYPENPTRILIDGTNNRWRLVKKADLGKYVIRKFTGKIRRVWIQPSWVEKCSPRKHIKEQSKYDVLNF
jgi:polynucleotide 5'-kinase involved in rRNA processing